MGVGKGIGGARKGKGKKLNENERGKPKRLGREEKVRQWTIRGKVIGRGKWRRHDSRGEEEGKKIGGERGEKSRMRKGVYGNEEEGRR